ncbi:MAG: rod shape-determining protein MreC [Candidatus Omnitrophota bacterium]
MPGRKSKFIVYGLLILAVFFLLFLPPSFFLPLKGTVVNIVSMPIHVISYSFKELKKIATYHRTHDRYQKLKLDYDILRERLIGMDEVLKENNRLAKLLDFKRGLIFSSIAANVIGRDPSNWNSVIIIDRGLEDGVAQGMPVVSALGVVGKVAEADAEKSKVILLTDPDFSVAALVKRSREVGLVSGTLQGMSQMRYLSRDSDVQVGDVIITSKLSSSFPEGLIIGEVVEKYKDDNSLTIYCKIRPAAAVSQLEEVLVVHKK